jgi:hypothetical protein
MNYKYRKKKLRATSVDSRLTKEEQFKRLLDAETIENITNIDRRNFTHTLTTKLLIKLLQDKRVHLPSSELRML